MIGAEADHSFAARLIAKARALGEARAEQRALSLRENPRGGRSARLLWPLFTKG